MSISISIPTPENLKAKAKIARKFLKDKCNAEVSHGHCIELISQLYGFKDWNTAKAEIFAYERVKALASIRSKTLQVPSSVKGMNVGELRKALDSYEDSAMIDADFDFNLGEFMNSIDELQNPEDMIHQEFAFASVEKVDDNYANLKLTLRQESFSFTY